MKKIIAAATSLVTALSMSAFPVFAADKPVPADIPELIYEQLLKSHGGSDPNNDGIMSQEEFEAMNYISVSLDGVDSLDWITKMKELVYADLRGGEITDFSILADCPKLSGLALKDVPMTDVSCLKNLDLDCLALDDMEQIDLEQRMSLIKYGNVSVENGFCTGAGITPIGLFKSYDIKFRIDDPDIADFPTYFYETDEDGKYYPQEDALIYGLKPGKTMYHIYLNGEMMFESEICVDDFMDSELQNVRTADYKGSCARSEYYSDTNMLLLDGVVYGIKDGELIKYDEDAAALNHYYINGASLELGYHDCVIFNDGSMKINGVPVELGDVRVKKQYKNLLISEDDCLYSLRWKKDKFDIVLVRENVADLLPGSAEYAVSTDGELLCLEGVISADYMEYEVYQTGIYDIVLSETPNISTRYFLTKEGVLYEVGKLGRPNPTLPVTEIAKNVVSYGYADTSVSNFSMWVYTTADGEVFSASDGIKINDPVKYITLTLPESSGKRFGNAVVIGDNGSYGSAAPIALTNFDYCLSYDGILGMRCGSMTAKVSDVSDIMGAVKTDDGAVFYFVRSDNTIWKYSFPVCEAEYLGGAEKPEIVMGDMNNDVYLNSADLVLLSRYLLGDSNEKRYCLKYADFNGDGEVDVFDLCLMRKALIDSK